LTIWLCLASTLRRILTSIAAPVLISVYGELIRRSIPLRRRFYRIHRRRYSPAYPDAANSARHWLTSRIPSWKERLGSFSQRCGRSIYTPFLSAAALES
jgi:hypothetical protein